LWLKRSRSIIQGRTIPGNCGTHVIGWTQ